jgi:superfamily II DNA or RNA helicase
MLLTTHFQMTPTTFTTSLADRLASQVRSAVRTRGRSYFRSGAVVQVGGQDRTIQAEVNGSQPYAVYVGVGEAPDELDASCSCPYFEDRFDICKHIWAVILYADRHGLLSLARGVDSLYLMPDMRFTEGAGDETDAPRPSRFPRRGIWSRNGSRRGKHLRPAPPPWQHALSHVLRTEKAPTAEDRLDPDTRQILYLIDTHAFPRRVSVTVATRERKMDGSWGKPRPWRVNDDTPGRVPDPRDAEILSLLLGSDLSHHGYSGSYYSSFRHSYVHSRGESLYFLRRPTEAALLERMCRTDRCFLPPADGEEPAPLRWDDRPAWELRLAVEEAESDRSFRMHGRLVRPRPGAPEGGDESVSLDDPRLRIGNAVAFFGTLAAPAALAGEAWTNLGASREPIEIPSGDREAFLEQLLTLPAAPPLDLPPSLHVETVRLDPVPLLTIDEPVRRRATNPLLVAQLRFRYAAQVVEHGQAGPRLYDPSKRRLLLRNLDSEGESVRRLAEVGFRVPRYRSERDTPFTLPAKRLGPAVRTLVAEGWVVEAKGKVCRTPGEFRLEVTSGIDWFDLDGSLEYGDMRATLPELLRAAAAGEGFVRLGDGTIGLLPEDWMARYGLLGSLGTKHGDRLRFSGAHVSVLDALLETLPETRYDKRFAHARRRLARSGGIPPASPPRTFRGRLREYQKEGLGWMEFLRDFGFGGCLADDMGLGKTVQVLALLDSRRRRRPRGEPNLPSLAVVPRSVLWNWHDEAARFTPRLRVTVYAGVERKPSFKHTDLVLTTYGTLHRDIVQLQKILFDYVVLDEAQAVKNPRTGRAKAVRLLQARYRLALSGTPIENHLGELWSLFEFLNPRMLGSASGFQKLAGGNGRNGDIGAEGPSLVARAVRPFILRRTKKQVAPELPERSEQTIMCELKGNQLRHYHELRDHYRASLMRKVEEVGLNRSKIHVLEALLRLRQAACHPGLIDPGFREEAGAKIEALVPKLLEIVEEGNKALVFSQFTRFLALVREQLDRAGVVYEYLDGRTRKREDKVARFQEDPDCPLFLISLKAGGLGLNLTAAGYVFLLDPWWNPAVEAQAIDRAHRIGQTRQVFAYRLIARDTVEERILELQDAKRDLAASIITEDRGLMQKLRPEDLDVLLS